MKNTKHPFLCFLTQNLSQSELCTEASHFIPAEAKKPFRKCGGNLINDWEARLLDSLL